MDRLKRLPNSVFADYKTEVVLCVIGLAITLDLTYLTYFSYPGFAPSDTIQAITLIVLAVVTVAYAKSTHKIYKATSEQVNTTREAIAVSKRSVEIALNAEKNAVAPLIKFQLFVTSTSFYGLQANYENIGKGPALNLKLWIDADGEIFSYLKGDVEKSISFQTAVGVGESGSRTWIGDTLTVPPRHLPANNAGFNVIAEYTDVFGQGFESRLVIINQYDRKFHYGQVRNEHD